MSRIPAFPIILLVFIDFRTAQGNGKAKAPLEDYHHKGGSFVDSLKEELSLLVLSEFNFQHYYFGKDEDSREFIYFRLILVAFRRDTKKRQAIAIFEVLFLREKAFYSLFFFVCLEECKMYEKEKKFEFVLNVARPPIIFEESSRCELEASKLANGTDWVKYKESTNINKTSRKAKFIKYFKKGAKVAAQLVVVGGTIAAFLLPPLGVTVAVVELFIAYCLLTANYTLIERGYIKYARIPISEKEDNGKLTPQIVEIDNRSSSVHASNSKAHDIEVKTTLTNIKEDKENIVTPSSHTTEIGGNNVTNIQNVGGNDARDSKIQSDLSKKNVRVEDQQAKSPLGQGKKDVSETKPLLNHKDENSENKENHVAQNSEKKRYEYQKIEPLKETKKKFSVECSVSTEYAGPFSTLSKNKRNGSEVNSAVR